MYDFLIIGAGISGAAVGYELAQHGKVVIVEAETQPGFHSTGRSAALYTPNYGPDLVRRICQLSLPFLTKPPNTFVDHALLSSRGMLNVFPVDSDDAIKEKLASGGADFVGLTQKQTLDKVPFLRFDRVGGAVYEHGVNDLDVDVLHQGFLRGVKNRGGNIVTDCRIQSIVRKTSGWEVESEKAKYTARIVVNAAGAWADEIGAMANASAIGLQAKRRSAILIDGPEQVDLSTIPAIDFVGVQNYIKPEAGKLMVSPGDEFPVTPHDVQPDDLDIAVLVDWLERETAIEVTKVSHSWAGLRNFVADGLPVVGFDTLADDFFWLAGQGGYGIMMSAPLARAGASLMTRQCLPQDFISAGITEGQLSAQRLATKSE